MISLTQFSTLRLKGFVDDVVALSDWEFLGRVWIGEAVGFTEWLRAVEAPEALASVALALTALPVEVSTRMFARFELPLRAGMTLPEIASALEMAPMREQRFVKDRATFDFRVVGEDAFTLSCTVLEVGGLSHVLIVAPGIDIGG